MTRKDIPNLITLLRLLLIVPVVWTLLHGQLLWSLALFILAGVSDAVDGYLARRYQWHSHLGGWLDPIADKALQVSVYLALAWLGYIPWWLLAAVVGRDLVIISGGVVYYFLIERVSARPTGLSKLNTLLQMLLVVVLLLHHGSYTLPGEWVNGLVYLVFAVTVLSGLHYVITWSIQAWRVKHGRRET